MSFLCYRRLMLLPTAIAVWMVLLPPPVLAGLEGGVIVGGQGVIVNSNLVVQDSTRLAINATAFGLQSGENFTLQQNLITDIALIRVLGQDPSSIFGNIYAKGQLFISNPNGVLFGSGAQVNVGGLAATSLGLDAADFMAGQYVFSNLGGAGTVVNQGRLTATQGGYIALLAPEVRNEGVISASLGTALLAAGDKVTLNLDDGSLFGYTIDKGALHALAENKQLIQADGGQVFMGARAADAITTAAVSNSGIVRARTVKNNAGIIRLSGDAVVTNTGTLDASAPRADNGGAIELSGRFIALGGRVDASGQVDGGQIYVHASGDMSLADHVVATGAAGHGGSVRYEAGGQIIESSSSYTDVSGGGGGSISANADGGIISSGTYRALGTAGAGGRVDLSGYSVRLLSAAIDASGTSQGGLVRIGGAFQGGKHNPDTQAYDQFVTRWQASSEIENAQRLFVNDSTQVNVSSAQGAGGTVIFWSDKETTQLGHVNAGGMTHGGVVEISSAETLRQAGLTGVAGADTILLDPKNIIIGDSTSIASWNYTASLGAGYTGGSNVNVASVAGYDYFGTAVALNVAGTLLAVGLFGDDGAGNVASSSGAVQLFSFTDGNFSGGALQATIGKGYAGGNNIDVASLDSNDFFGASVSLNAVGDRLAVGAFGDDGAGNIAADVGAAYLFSFNGSNFSGGSLQATVGKGYAGGKNMDVAGLEMLDSFGSAVALNAVGDRLAVGAYADDGAGNVAADSGAVYLYGFSDSNFNGGSLHAIAGKGYTGGNNVDMSSLGNQDHFGVAASFNGMGDRLAVGAFGDDGAANLATDSGAVYLLGFADNSFIGGSLLATVGKGYSGGSNINLALDSSDGFGRAVALNAAGDRLAAGAFNDDGAGNLAAGSGAVYLFDFSDNHFSGGSLKATIGRGYTGVGDIDLASLDAGDYFGTSVALNGLGDRLAVGAILDDGAGNAALDRGAVHLFSLIPDPLASVINFADYPDQTITLLNTDLAAMLNAGTNVVLQASNDITVASAVTVNNTGGDGGSLTLHAGRNINFDANVTTDNGNLTAVAGDTGAITSERDPGTATIIIGNGVTLDVGTGMATLAAAGGNFINNSGSTAPIIASRWSVYSTDPSLNALGGMTATGKHYNQPYVAGSTPAYAATGNWLFYSIAPVLSVTPSQQTVSDGNHPDPFSATYSGFIDGDTAQTSGISGTATFVGGGAAPGFHNIDYVNGLLSSLGYTFVNNAASSGELFVIAQENIPGDVITDAQNPSKEASDDKPLEAGCGGELLITSSAGAVFERFIGAEDDTCGLDFTSDDSADGDGKGDSKKRKCGTDESGKAVKGKAQKL